MAYSKGWRCSSVLCVVHIKKVHFPACAAWSWICTTSSSLVTCWTKLDMMDMTNLSSNSLVPKAAPIGLLPSVVICVPVPSTVSYLLLPLPSLLPKMSFMRYHGFFMRCPQNLHEVCANSSWGTTDSSWGVRRIFMKCVPMLPGLLCFVMHNSADCLCGNQQTCKVSYLCPVPY